MQQEYAYAQIALRHWAVVTLVPIVAACATTVAPYDRQVGLETFDAAWRIVHESHFDTTFNGVDWVALREELRPRAEAATEREELRGTIREMLGRLGQSHFGLIPKEAADTLDPEDGDPGLDTVGDLGFDFRLIADTIVVTQVDEEGPALAAGVEPGWTLVRVDDGEIDEVVRALRADSSRYTVEFRAWRRVSRLLAGEQGTGVRLEFRDSRDRPVTLDLVRRRDPSVPVKIGNLPTFFGRAARRAVPGPDGLRVGVIWFNVWMVPLLPTIDTAVHEFRSLDGIVMDLRGNPGGVGGMVMGVAGHFLDDRIQFGTFRTRTTNLRHAANPRRVSPMGERVTPFAGPVAVLVDELSASASETFAGGMQSIGRVRVFGQRTAGAVLPARMDRLPNGDVLYHAFAEFVTADGVTLEGRGVIPDESIAPTRAALVAGHDPILDAAVAWIADQRNRTSGGVGDPCGEAACANRP